jgi:hypothetical protein
MAKIKGLDRAAKRIARATRGALAGDKRFSQSVLSFLVDQIRNGKLPSGKNVKRLKRVTIERRRQLSRKNRTHPDFSPAKSNLTFSGQFLDSFKVVVDRVKSAVRIRISPTGTHKGVTYLNGKRARGVRNEEIGRGLIEGGRDYRPISKKNRSKIGEFVLTALRRSLRL